MNNDSHARVVAELLSRQPEHQVGPSLARIQALVELLGDPHRSAPVIHVTGTNGKGSTAIMIDALLRAQGLRTGRYSSPHLVDLAERIYVDGRPVTTEIFDDTWAADQAFRRDRRRDGDRRHPDDVLRGHDRPRVRGLRRRARRRGRPRGRHGRHLGRDQRRRRHRRRDHADLGRPHRVPGLHARRDRGGEGRDHQAGLRRSVRRADAGRGPRSHGAQPPRRAYGSSPRASTSPSSTGRRASADRCCVSTRAAAGSTT